MIWSDIPAVDGFVSAYQTYLLALEGAIERGVAGLRQGSTRLALSNGLNAVNMTIGSTVPAVSAARMAIAEAVSIGRTHGAGRVDPGLQIRHAQDIEVLIVSIQQTDANKARLVIRNQALAYDVASRQMTPAAALAKATGQLGNDPFTQLDRASRRFQSADLALGYVRLAAAQAYFDAFVMSVADAGVTQVLLAHPDEEDQLIDLADLPDLRELFHPNTRYTLKVAS